MPELRAPPATGWQLLDRAFCCENGCTTKAQMRAQHGSPMAFAEAAWRAVDMVTPREIRSAIARYEELYDDAPDGP